MTEPSCLFKKKQHTTQDHNICLFVPQDTILPPEHIPLQITSKNCPKGTSQSRTLCQGNK